MELRGQQQRGGVAFQAGQRDGHVAVDEAGELGGKESRVLPGRRGLPSRSAREMGMWPGMGNWEEER